ncbi:hypothetical protein GS506_06590 [Rhodococcus hoagii]|nr:hypothetical protein [Prescottella equi]
MDSGQWRISSSEHSRGERGTAGRSGPGRHDSPDAERDAVDHEPHDKPVCPDDESNHVATGPHNTPRHDNAAVNDAKHSYALCDNAIRDQPGDQHHHVRNVSSGSEPGRTW